MTKLVEMKEKRKIKKGDTVIVLTGKSKGASGKILRVKGDKVLVEGANLVKKNVRANPNAGEQGGILDREAFIHISNVALQSQLKKDSSAKKHSKIGYKVLENGKKVRYFKDSGELVDIE